MAPATTLHARRALRLRFILGAIVAGSDAPCPMAGGCHVAPASPPRSTLPLAPPCRFRLARCAAFRVKAFQIFRELGRRPGFPPTLSFRKIVLRSTWPCTRRALGAARDLWSARFSEKLLWETILRRSRRTENGSNVWLPNCRLSENSRRNRHRFFRSMITPGWPGSGSQNRGSS